MTTGTHGARTESGPAVPAGSSRTVVRGACALAAAMGLGRFVYTPILPLMQSHAGLTAEQGGHVATANYLGYLVGAAVSILDQRLARSVPALRVSLVVLGATLAGMPLTHDVVVWAALRAVAGVASALVFVVAANATAAHLRHGAGHRVGWVYGGVGGGIALSGLLVIVLRSLGTWSQAWWAATVLFAALAAVAWGTRAPPPPGPSAAAGEGGEGGEGGPAAGPTARSLFPTLLAAYVLEGGGYIIAGTFLVAALARTGPGWLGGGAWVLVGLAAIPSCAAWAALSRSRSRPALLVVALTTQAVGIALPALVPGVASAVVSAVVFGGTFMGVTTLALSAGLAMRVPHGAAVLTAGYATGQVLGPLAVAPLLGSGYHVALLVAAVVVLAAAGAATVLRARSGRPTSS